MARNTTPDPVAADPAPPEPVFVTDFNGVEVLRVKATDTKHELTIGRAAFETEPKAWIPINKPALNCDGTHAAPKHHKDLSAQQAGERSPGRRTASQQHTQTHRRL